MNLEEQFKEASEKVNLLSTKPSNDQLLKLYAYYKQGSEGNIKSERPVGFDFKAIAKYDAWASLLDVSQAEAQRKYIDLVNNLITNN